MTKEVRKRNKTTTTINDDNDKVFYSLNTRDCIVTGYKYARTFRLDVETPSDYRGQ
jgi:hypothetical protein